jgi:hypothetical protein
LLFPIFIWRSLFNCPTLTTIHDLYPYEFPENFGYPNVIFNQLFLKQCINHTNVTIIITAFCSAFYPRIIETAGAPSIINFIHYLTVPFAFTLAISTTHTKNKYQIAISWQIITACLILLGVMFCSALLNQAGIINIILDYLLLVEPFLLLTQVASYRTPGCFAPEVAPVSLALTVINIGYTTRIRKYSTIRLFNVS